MICNLPQAVGLEHLFNEMLLRDLEFFAFDVAGDMNDLHAVLQRPRDLTQHVRGAHEHDLRQVVVEVHVVVVERVVLFRIEHFEERRRRIAAEVHRHFVDLVEQEDGVA